MDHVEELVITPFRDVIDKGNEAILNSDGSPTMLQASQALVKEGEGCLKRIEPQCRDMFGNHGHEFGHALRANEEINDLRFALLDVLWDFDDYVEADDFDADKFTQLRALTRKVGQRIYNIIRNMKIEPPPGDSNQPFSQGHAPPSPEFTPQSLVLSPVAETSSSAAAAGPASMESDIGAALARHTLEEFGKTVQDITATAQPNTGGPSCQIDRSSSFNIYKGFCEGAKKALRGETCITAPKRGPFTSSLGTEVVQCTDCNFMLDYSQIRLDHRRDDKGSFRVGGISYRLRFLQKSHMQCEGIEDLLYGCVFCVESGHTTNPCDATVFTSTKSLFRHLERHSRPLPIIEGMTVINFGDIKEGHLNNYDIHFRTAPGIHPAQTGRKLIDGLPTGVVREVSRRMFGQKEFPTGESMLKLCKGARLTGIRWPYEHFGEWIYACHDGDFGHVAAELVLLDEPPPSKTATGKASTLKAKARWKFKQKPLSPDATRRSNWLSFDKDEQITNISFVSPEYWCWSGTNSKGIHGIFPQEFIDIRPVADFDETASTIEYSSRLSSDTSRSSLLPWPRWGRTPDVRSISTAISSIGEDGVTLYSRRDSVRSHVHDDKLNKDLHKLGSVSGILEHADADVVAAFLDKNFDLAAQGEYSWIKELKEVGYTHAEIAELLYERAHDSPWMYFEPTTFDSKDILPNHHLSGCAHDESQRHSRDLEPWQDRDREVMLAVEELCGLGGISPSSRHRSDWNGSAEFGDQNSLVKLRHHLLSPFHPIISPEERTYVAGRLSRVADRFCTAVRMVQDAGYCCDSFTIFHLTAVEVVLVSVKFELAQRMANCLRDLSGTGTCRPNSFGTAIITPVAGAESQLWRTLTDTSLRILTLIRYPVDWDYSIRTAVYLVSLALQVLNVGFLSYAQAHIGQLQPFFLDTPLEAIELLGVEQDATPPRITAKLVELTCLADMCQGPVLAFYVQRPTATLSRYNVRAFPKDILDTWGPGELVFRPNDERPCAIKVGGGYISPGAGENRLLSIYHWGPSLDIGRSSETLSPDREIVIGGLVALNRRCNNDEKTCWEESSGRFEELGTFKRYFESLEYQLGFQGGPDHFSVTCNKVWAKRRGKTVKARNLEREDGMLVSFLDCYWGVKVSFCTGVAQRVPLRQLVADLLPAFAESLIGSKANDAWTELASQHDIFNMFRGPGSLRTWLGALQDDKCLFVLGLIRLILGTLEDTGISPDGTHFLVAWPYDGIVNRCFRIPLGDDNKWAPMLADSDDCATFAYISNDCLEARNIKCRGPNPQWQDKISLLETSVLCPASTDLLRHEQTYFFHKLNNNLFWVKCTRSSVVALVRLDSIRSLPSDVRRRLMFNEERKRQRRLREKDLPAVRAEIVSVLSQTSAHRLG